MVAIYRAVVIGLTVALALSGCVGAVMRDRDIDMGANRYLVTVNGNALANLAQVEMQFQARAREVATRHGFDSYRVSEFSSRYEPTPSGPQPVAKGVVYVYNAAKTAADGRPVRPAGSKATGTAFAINADGVLLTNAHVAQECREISVRRADGVIVPASLLASDRSNDLALIKVASPTPEFAQFRGSPDIRQGDSVVAVGFPLSDLLSAGAGTTLTTGTVSSLAGYKGDTRLLQVSAPIQPGNSGGPLLDQGGSVVAIVSSGLDRLGVAVDRGVIPENVNFAIKASVARAFMDAADVAYRVTPSSRPVTTAEIGNQARKFTHFVTCTT